CVLQTEAQQQVPQDGLFGLSRKALEGLRIRELGCHSVNRSRPFAFSFCSRIAAEDFEELSPSSAEAEPKHVEDSGKNCGEIEILNRNWQSLFVVAGPDFAVHAPAEHIIDDRSGNCSCLGSAHFSTPDLRGLMVMRCSAPLSVPRIVAETL